MKIYLISPEILPFAETNDIARVSGEISNIIHELKHDIRMIMPKYPFIGERKYILREVIRLKEIAVPWEEGSIISSIKSAFIPNTKVQVYFLQQDTFYNKLGEKIYKAKGARKVMEGTDERFTYFCKAALESLKYLHWQPDVIHCYGWATSMAPVLLKRLFEGDGFFAKMKVVFSPFQSKDLTGFSGSVLKAAKLTEENGVETDIEFDSKGCFSPIAEGLRHSDATLIIDRKQKDLSRGLKSDAIFGPILKSKKMTSHIVYMPDDEKETYERAATEILDFYQEVVRS